MQITLESKPLGTLETEALVTFVFENGDVAQGRLAELDKLTSGLLSRLTKSGELTGKSLEMTLLHAPAGLKAARLLLVGAGKRDKFDAVTLRKIAGAALRFLKTRSVHNFVFAVREGHATQETAQAITEAAIAADFETDKYKTEKKNEKFIDGFSIAGYADAEKASGEKGIVRGRIIGEAQNFTRDLVNEPSNKLTPRLLAEKAEAMAKQAGLSVEILDEKKIAELKMGALLSVAQGSVEPPRMIVITYAPANPKPGAPVIGLVGKAVTFDTGGISIKPADGMEKMKYDMAGGATMLGIMRALAAQAKCQSHLCSSLDGKYARRKSAEARGHSDCHVGEDHRSVEHGRRRPPDSCRWRALCQAAGRHASRGRRHPHRCNRCGARQYKCRCVRLRSGVDREAPVQRQSRRRKNVAVADG